MSNKDLISYFGERYGLPANVECIKSLEELNKLEIFSQEEIKNNPNFKIRDYFLFQRSEYGRWPDCSIIGDELYRKGEIEEAYRVFHSIRVAEVSPIDLPMWSQGLYGMLLAEPVDSKNIDIELVYKGAKSGSKKLECCVGFDINYLPFFNIYKKSMRGSGFAVNAILCYEDAGEITEVMARCDLNGVNLYTVPTPKKFRFRNKKGFYTLSRYLLASKIFESREDLSGLIITDVDAVLQEPSMLDPYLEEDYDIGLLELRKPRRPWLKNTAPFLFISNSTSGRVFIKGVGGRVGKIVEECVEGGEVSLWGADQAAITSTLDWFYLNKSPLKLFNFIKSVKFFMAEAQSISKNKQLFIEKYL